jgi:hypothetical protein
MDATGVGTPFALGAALLLLALPLTAGTGLAAEGRRA